MVMVLEREILPFFQWLFSSLSIFFIVILVIGLLGCFAGFLLNAMRYGPAAGIAATINAISDGIKEFFGISFRRVYAMAQLAYKESLRRWVLAVFAIFLVFLLFAAWYLEQNNDHPGRLYISVVMTVSAFLMMVLAIFLSTFSIPNDLKNKTIYTIVTKPVRAWELILGRIIGFTFIGTLMLLFMCICSYIFVRRGLQHDHSLTSEVVANVSSGNFLSDDERTEKKTTTTTSNFHPHRHQVRLDEEGKVQLLTSMDHTHEVDVEGEEYAVSSPVDMFRSRVPVRGTLQFLDRAGKPKPKGINIGKEWGYRGYIEGGTLCAAIWTFEGVTPAKFPDGIPIDMGLRVFRTYHNKDTIEIPIYGRLELVRPAEKQVGPNGEEMIIPSRNRVRSAPKTFAAVEFIADQQYFPRKLEVIDQDGSPRDADIFDDLVVDGKVELWIYCEEPQQYFGMASSDVYILAGERPVWQNFAKGFFGIWCQMFIVICLGVMFSTFLNAPVAMLATLASIILGYQRTFIADLATGQQEGGGPGESAIRLLHQMNLSLELEQTASTTSVRAIDAITLGIMRAVSYVLPSFDSYTTTRFVAYGYNIDDNLVLQQLLSTLAYGLVITVLGYFFFKSREIAA